MSSDTVIILVGPAYVGTFALNALLYGPTITARALLPYL